MHSTVVAQCAACRYADAVPEAIPVHKQLLDVMNGNVEYDASSCKPSSRLPSKSLDEHARGLAPQFLASPCARHCAEAGLPFLTIVAVHHNIAS
jgi:hypothetical protein